VLEFDGGAEDRVRSGGNKSHHGRNVHDVHDMLKLSGLAT
jgi:hypothetical protein